MGEGSGKRVIKIFSIVSLGLALRLVGINQSFWLDEAAQLIMSSQSLSFIWFGRSGDFHPPLYYLLTHFWMLLGRSEMWLRLLPIVFGLINIPVLVFLARELFQDKFIAFGKARFDMSLLAGFFLAIAPFHIYYSQEMRSYSLLCLLGTCSFLLLIKKNYKTLSLVNSLLLYTHYSAIFLIISQIVYVFHSSRHDTRRLLLSLFLTLIMFLPWTPQLVSQVGSGVNIDDYLPGWRNVLSISPLKTIPVTIFKIVAGRISLTSRFIYGLYILFVFAVSFAGLFFASKHRNLLMAWITIPIFTMLLVSLVLPQSQPFRVIYILPGFILAFVQACFRFPKLFLTSVLYIFLVGDLLYFTRPRLQREDWISVSRFITSQNLPVFVKFTDRFAPLAWYAPNQNIYPLFTKFPGTEIDSQSQLSLVDESNRILILDYLSGLSDPMSNAEKSLKYKGWSLNKTYNFEGVGFVFEYAK